MLLYTYVFILYIARIVRKKEKTKMILVGMGGNLDSVFGSVYQTAEQAFVLLEQKECRVGRRSGWYKTAPVPVSSLPWYRTRVFTIETEKTAREVLEILLSVEAELGRVRTVRNAPRVLDLDLLAYHDEIIDAPPELIVPHPRMHLRAFVLYPLQEIAPNWVHPKRGQNIAEMIENLPPEQEILKE